MAIKAVTAEVAPSPVLRQIWNVQFVGAAGNDNLLIFDALQKNASKKGPPLATDVASLVLEGSVFTLRGKEPIAQDAAVSALTEILNSGVGSGYTVEGLKNDAVRVRDWKVGGQTYPKEPNDILVARYKAIATGAPLPGSNVDDMREETQLEKDLAAFALKEGQSDDQPVVEVPHTAGQKLGNNIAGTEEADESTTTTTTKPAKPTTTKAPLSTLNPNPTKMSTPQRK